MLNNASPPVTSVTSKPGIQQIAAFVLMAASLAVASWLTPRTRWYDQIGDPDYQTIVPKNFGDWVNASDETTGFVDPAITESLNAIYSQIVNRIYVHKPTGRKIMLSLAYGITQQGVTQLHRPEACYSSQGFKIENIESAILPIGHQSIPIFRMSTSLKQRTEQVTYWIRIGDRTIDGPPYRLNLVRMALGLRGIIADGLLFRTSEISPNVSDSYHFQDQFISDLLDSLKPAQQRTLIGVGR